MDFVYKRHLPRLVREYYRADAFVFWTLTVEGGSGGWLNANGHHRWREILLHVAAREGLYCPCYCLMPDHLHLVWLGTRPDTDQLNAMQFVRRQFQPQPSSTQRWQHQAHDHVLQDAERDHDALGNACWYTLANPVRAALVTRERDWPYSGAVVPGYPNLHPFQDGFWDLFWKLYLRERNRW